jgi:fermentation-respiration switch protein FrsA (DUF1100 family)
MKIRLATTAAAIAIGIGSVEAAQIQRVTFESQGQTLVGNLYLPDDYQADQKLPGVVVTGAWTTVKEQMAASYAEELTVAMRRWLSIFVVGVNPKTPSSF